ncbi:MAG: hypothetical protein AAGH89_01030 [Verrucomicrobiota bacterium]
MAENLVTSSNARDYTNSQLLDLGNDVVDLLIPSLPDEDVFLGELLDDLRFTVLDLARAMGRNAKSSDVDEVEMLGARRDQLWGAFKAQVRCNHEGTSAEERQAFQGMREWIGSGETEISVLDFIDGVQGVDRERRLKALQDLQMAASAEELIQADTYLEIARREAEESASQSAEPPRLVPVKADFSKYLRLLLKNLAYLAEKGRHPYIAISADCSELIAQSKLEAKPTRSRMEEPEGEGIGVSA